MLLPPANKTVGQIFPVNSRFQIKTQAGAINWENVRLYPKLARSNPCFFLRMSILRSNDCFDTSLLYAAPGFGCQDYGNWGHTQKMTILSNQYPRTGLINLKCGSIIDLQKNDSVDIYINVTKFFNETDNLQLVNSG